MRRLVECVPNFSEGRDQAKIDAIVSAMREVPGVLLLDRESDPDHNRCVITLAGEPEPVAEAAIRGVGKASELIDLAKHAGAHPRIGATDVVPFVPVSGVSLEECVALAHKAGEEIWRRFKVPIYFYEAAAIKPERANLENIRRGQFEGLREEALLNPERAPDLGGPALHPAAGATVVGARKFLIAYNIHLKTTDVALAKTIAKTIRTSSGGFPFVKAMGLPVPARGVVEVSMNLTDFERTPMHQVYAAVESAAKDQGVEIADSEIVGLVPRRAIEMTAEFFLRFPNFSSTQVLENRLEEALLEEISPKQSLASMVQPFLEAVSRPTPTPGGGSVAAMAAALAASLGQMVAGLSSTKKSQAAHRTQLEEAASEFASAKQSLTEAVELDASSYQAVLAAHRLPHTSDDGNRARQSAIEEAFKGAVEVPLQVGRAAARLLRQLGQLETASSPSMISDVRVARFMAAAALRGALENVEINLTSIADTEFVRRARNEANELRAAIPASF
jgi:glutamate formiminotransferase / formiminotetrahydrofolate cyclodeaminase